MCCIAVLVVASAAASLRIDDMPLQRDAQLPHSPRGLALAGGDLPEKDEPANIPSSATSQESSVGATGNAEEAAAAPAAADQAPARTSLAGDGHVSVDAPAVAPGSPASGPASPQNGDEQTPPGLSEEWEEQISTVQRGLESLLRESTEDVNRANTTLQRIVAEDDDAEDEVTLPFQGESAAPEPMAQGSTPGGSGLPAAKPGDAAGALPPPSGGTHHRPEVTVVKADVEPQLAGSEQQPGGSARDGAEKGPVPGTGGQSGQGGGANASSLRPGGPKPSTSDSTPAASGNATGGSPPLPTSPATPPAPPSMSDLLLVPSRAGETCDATCERSGELVCKRKRGLLAADCGAMVEAFGCKAPCAQAHGVLLASPALVSDWPAVLAGLLELRERAADAGAAEDGSWDAQSYPQGAADAQRAQGSRSPKSTAKPVAAGGAAAPLLPPSNASGPHDGHTLTCVVPQMLPLDGAPAGSESSAAWALDCAASHPSARRLCPCGRMSALAEENKRLRESLAAEAKERLEELTVLSKHVRDVLRGFASSRLELKEKDMAILEQQEEDEAMARAHAIMEALETVEYETGMVKLADGTTMLFHEAKQEAEDILLDVSDRAKERANERATEALHAEEHAGAGGAQAEGERGSAPPPGGPLTEDEPSGEGADSGPPEEGGTNSGNEPDAPETPPTTPDVPAPTPGGSHPSPQPVGGEDGPGATSSPGPSESMQSTHQATAEPGAQMAASPVAGQGGSSSSEGQPQPGGSAKSPGGAAGGNRQAVPSHGASAGLGRPVASASPHPLSGGDAEPAPKPPGRPAPSGGATSRAHTPHGAGGSTGSGTTASAGTAPTEPRVRPKHAPGEGSGLLGGGSHDPAILSYNAVLLQDIAALLAAAALGGIAAALVGAPPSFGYLLGGAIAGPSGLGLVANLEQVGTVAQFGVVFPLFANGLQFHLKDHARFHKQAAITALALSASLMGLFALLGMATGLVSGVTEGVLIGLAASVCSPGVAIANLVHLGHLTRTAGHIGTGIMAAQDLLMGLLLSLPHALAPYLQHQRKADASHHRHSAGAGHSALPPAAGQTPGTSIGRHLAVAGTGAWEAASGAVAAVASATGAPSPHGRRLAEASAGTLGASHVDAAPHLAAAEASLSAAEQANVSPVFLAAGALLKSAAAFVLVALLTALVSRRIVPSVVDFLGQRGQQRDVHLLALVGLCMVLGVATEAAGLSLEMGAFFAGLMVAGAKDIERVMKAVDPLAQVFSGMFFASIGLVISPSYVLAKAPVIVSAIAVLFVVKTVLLFAVTRWLGFETRHAVITAVALAQVSEYSLIFTGKAHAIGLMDRATYLRWMTATIGALVTSPLFARTAPFILRALGVNADGGAQRPTGATAHGGAAAPMADSGSDCDADPASASPGYGPADGNGLAACAHPGAPEQYSSPSRMGASRWSAQGNNVGGGGSAASPPALPAGTSTTVEGVHSDGELPSQADSTRAESRESASDDGVALWRGRSSTPHEVRHRGAAARDRPGNRAVAAGSTSARVTPTFGGARPPSTLQRASLLAAMSHNARHGADTGDAAQARPLQAHTDLDRV